MFVIYDKTYEELLNSSINLVVSEIDNSFSYLEKITKDAVEEAASTYDCISVV